MAAVKRIVSYPIMPYAVALCVVVAAALPFSDVEMPEFAKVLLAGAAVTASVAQLATCALLLSLFRRSGRASIATLAAVYLASGIVAAAFPGAIPFGRGHEGLVFLQPKMAAWVWIAWHGVFAGGALWYAVMRGREGRDAMLEGRPKVVLAATAGGAALGVGVVVVAALGTAWLPPLINAGDLSGYRTSGVGSAILVLCAAALFALLRVRNRSARDAALLLTVFAVTLEMATNVLGAHRFSLLWYVGRALYTFASPFVLLATARDMFRWSERAVTLHLTLERQQRATERHAARMRALWQTNSSIADDDAFLRAVLDEASHALREDVQFHAFVCHLACGEIVVDVADGAYTGTGAAVAGARYPVADSFLGGVIGDGTTQSSPDVRDDERFGRSARLRSLPWRGFIGTPFRVAQTLYYLGFAAPEPIDGGFEPLDHGYVETLAGICAARLQQRAQFERVRYQTEHDLLTGIYNRATFRAHGFAAVRAGRRVALAVVALDHFRALNDTLGHQTGDALLVEIAARLGEHAAPNDVIARIGGDLFGVLMDGVRSRSEAEMRVREYAAAFCDTFGTGDRNGTERVRVTASIGIALAPGDAEGFEELLARADAAVYEAKQEGRGRWAFFNRRAAMDFQAVRRLKDELVRAIAGDELVLHFQPHVELSSGRVGGVEALVRWNHPVRGLLPPAEFVPFAERHGLADELGAWVMRETIRISAPWRAADPAFTAWCNVSQSELRLPSLATRLKQLDPGLRGVGVEITEGAVLDDADDMARAITMLRDAGFSIALDDFGTGYSSLAHLRRLPVDVVKIDRSFIAGIPHDPHDAAIVDAVLSIGQRYGFDIIAEGVEKIEQEAALAGRCRYGQGYLYARPMPADAFERWMRERDAVGERTEHDVA